jgi:tetratricopeptide (TPR) repeat protein
MKRRTIGSGWDLTPSSSRTYHSLMAFRATGIGFAVFLLLPSVLFAQEKAPTTAAAAKEKGEAKLHYDQGNLHFNLDEWPQAIEEFKAAYRAFPDPTFLYNIAQCHRKLGNPTDASSFYKNYLRERPDAPNRAEVEKRIEEMQAQIAAQNKARETTAAAAVAPPSSAPSVPTATPAPTGGPTQQEPPPPMTPAAASPSPVQGSASQPAESHVAPAGLDLTTSTTAPQSPPSNGLTSKWWFWTAAGAVVATGVIVAVVATSQGSSPSAYRGNLDPFVLKVPR